ncbi:MAG: ATP-dependent sacrificial sulfur transferase LarE [Planctomycetaceae bacterium]|nr:ATP-dependent sacrificial sulfur transferase LarE [Planctomycetales bacterium]MCB9875081.1 ATP-dependent sacrificial sulfur transferase LarE [Planctomycetaceae bacterium]MCB9941050.1 ATP-dependent sacrificial sulfur transferase LarE [Planctomycetaceae bacterium]
MPTLDEKREQLLMLIRSFESCAVAFSAGVDSTVVAKAAQLALGNSAVAVTGTSASLASGELDEAKSLAACIGVRHVVIATDEFANASYTQNAPDRCYHCKTELYTQLDGIIEQLGVKVVLNGANVDDASDYRPGMKAASEHSVRSPLAECGFTKADVRALAEQWELPVWDKPATPCLSSRVAYGEEVTPERLRMIDRAEQLLRDQGLRDVRVRYHRGDLARIEVPADEIAKFIPAATRSKLADQLRQLGFKFVTIDIEGFRSGSLNSLVQLSANASAASPQ